MSFGLTMVQNAYVVQSLPDAIEQMHKSFGMGPWIVLNDFLLSNHVYRGEKGEDVTVDVAVTQSGDVQIELVQLKCDTPNALRDMYPGTGTVFHHVAHLSDDYDYEEVRAGLLAAGHPLSSEFSVHGQNICFFDTRASLGHMLELYEDIEHERGVYRHIREVCEGWDGKDLIVGW